MRGWRLRGIEHDPKLEQLSDQIARDLRKKIVTGRLPQGADIHS